MGINILVWDVLAIGLWIFARLCKWAGRENTGKRAFAVISVTLLRLFTAVILMFGLAMREGRTRDSTVSGVHTISRWIDGTLTLVRRLDTHYPEDDDTQLVTVQDLIGGQMVEVY